MAEFLNRRIAFSGYQWLVKSSGDGEKEGPGPNWFSDSEENVWVDREGRLHLRITARGGRWWCAEVVSERSFGHGRYCFALEGGVEGINEHVVLGLFTWDMSPEHCHREIDIEISRWGEVENDAGQFVVQPYEREGNLHRFPVPLGGRASLHTWDWRPDRVEFSLRALPAGELIEEWTYRGPDNPPPGNEKVRINLWLVRGRPPSDGKEVEVVVRSFRFER